MHSGLAPPLASRTFKHAPRVSNGRPLFHAVAIGGLNDAQEGTWPDCAATHGALRYICRKMRRKVHLDNMAAMPFIP
jgi:hypothetical protein